MAGDTTVRSGKKILNLSERAVVLRPASRLHFSLAGPQVPIGAIVGEFMSSSVGLGHAIFQAGSLYAIPKVFASLVGTITLALVLTFVVGKIEQLLTPWRRAG